MVESGSSELTFFLTLSTTLTPYVTVKKLAFFLISLQWLYVVYGEGKATNRERWPESA